jgi:hypothetical protein
MNDQEKELLKGLRGPSAQTTLDAKRYVSETAFHATIDAADRANGTNIGKQLRAIAFGTKAPATVAPVAPPTAVEVAAACKKFPRERCRDLFVREANKPGEIYSKLSKAERDEAKVAAKFFKVLDPDNTSSVSFSYETPQVRAAKKAAKEAAAKEVERKQAEFLPPGITKTEKGEILLTDAAAFNAWKAEQSAHKDALAFLEDAAN